MFGLLQLLSMSYADVLREVDLGSAVSYMGTFKFTACEHFLYCRRRVCVHVVRIKHSNDSDLAVWDVYAKWAPPAIDPSEETFVNCGFFTFNGATTDDLFTQYVKNGLKMIAPTHDNLQVETVRLSAMNIDDATLQLSCLAKQLSVQVSESTNTENVDPQAAPQDIPEPTDEPRIVHQFPLENSVVPVRLARAKTLPQVLLETSRRLKLKDCDNMSPTKKQRTAVPLVVFSDAKFYSGSLNYPGQFSLDCGLPRHGTASIYFHEDMDEGGAGKDELLVFQLGVRPDEGFIVDIKDAWVKGLQDFEGLIESQKESD